MIVPEQSMSRLDQSLLVPDFELEQIEEVLKLGPQ
jgi:hypothetical protein